MSTIRVIDAISKADTSEFLLPDFQREFTYDRSQQKNLLVSVFSFIPLGAIMTLKESPAKMSFRAIGRKSSVASPSIAHSSVDFVLDGQQRVTTLWACFTDVFHGLSLADRTELREDLSSLLRNRWILRVIPEEDEEDVFGYLYLDLDVNDLRKTRPEDIDSRLTYSRSLVGNPIWPWNDGATMDFPSYSSNSHSTRRLKNRVEQDGIIPVHRVFSSAAFLRHIGKRRKFRLLSLLDDLYAVRGQFDECNVNDLELLAGSLGVRDAQGFQFFTDSATRVNALDEKLDTWTQSMAEYFRQVGDQVLFNIKLDKRDLSKANVIFDVINQSGQKLGVFDLFCAKHPSVGVRKKVQEIVDSMKEHYGLSSEHGAEKRYLDLLMNVIRVVHHLESGSSLNIAKALKSDVFEISSDFVDRNIEQCAKSAAHSVEFAVENLGVRTLSELPYLLQLLPVSLAFYLANQSLNQSQKSLVKYVYWFSLFSGRYRELQNKFAAEDTEVIILHSAFSGQRTIPDYLTLSGPWGLKILNYEGYNNRDYLIDNDTDDSVGESVRKSLIQYILSKTPLDFPAPSGRPRNSGNCLTMDMDLEVHHIIPLATQTTIGQSAKVIRKSKGMINSPLNLTYISKNSNRFINTLSIQSYINKIDVVALVKHCIPSRSLAPYNPSDPNVLRRWLGERFDKIQSDILSQLQLLYDNID